MLAEIRCLSCPLAISEGTIQNVKGVGIVAQLATAMDPERTAEFAKAACQLKHNGVCPLPSDQKVKTG